MYSEVDSKHGLVRTTWKEIRNRVKSINPRFTSLVDELSPDDFSLYLVYLNYGQLKGDTISSFLPGCDGEIYRLNSPNLPKTVIDELGYGIGSSPFGMILDKYFEYYIDLPRLNLTLPRFVKGPGSIFPVSLIYQKSSNRSYAPNGILNVMSGCRSVFMLPHIGSKSNYERLQYDFNLKSPRPKNLYNHFEIFKELSSAPNIQKPWKSCLLYFSQQWIDKIICDPAWYKVKMFLGEQGLLHFEPETQRHLLDFVFSYIQIISNLKPNPYIVDTARHIIDTTIGNTPGYCPASNEDFLPIAAIEKPFIESYSMKKYFPTILHPKKFIFEKEQDPIYYSLQYPATHNFSPKSRTASSMLVEMRELSTIIDIFLKHLSEDDSFCSGTVYADISKHLTIRCLHNQEDKHKIIGSSNQILNSDHRFAKNYDYETLNEQRFAADGKFFRGCVSISKNSTT